MMNILREMAVWRVLQNRREIKIITIIFELLLSIGLCDSACVQVWIESEKKKIKMK